jgi:hypothetical protein
LASEATHAGSPSPGGDRHERADPGFAGLADMILEELQEYPEDEDE